MSGPPVRARPLLALVVIALVACSLAVACGGSDQSAAGGGGACPVGGSALPSQCAPSVSNPPAAAPGGGRGTPSAAPACTTTGDRAPDSFSTAVVTSALPDGLAVGDIRTGSGAPVRAGQTLTVQYTGWLSDGNQFDSSREPGAAPFQFVLGAEQVIPGWDEGLSTARVGTKRRLVVPPQLGYGATGSPPRIPPNATLVFDVEVLCAA